MELIDDIYISPPHPTIDLTSSYVNRFPKRNSCEKISVHYSFTLKVTLKEIRFWCWFISWSFGQEQIKRQNHKFSCSKVKPGWVFLLLTFRFAFCLFSSNLNEWRLMFINFKSMYRIWLRSLLTWLNLCEYFWGNWNEKKLLFLLLLFT